MSKSKRLVDMRWKDVTGRVWEVVEMVNPNRYRVRAAFNRDIYTASGDPRVYLARMGWVATIVGWDYDERDGVIVEVDNNGRRFSTTGACLTDPPEDAWHTRRRGRVE